MYQLTFYVPPSHLDVVKDALFAAGAGQFNGYQRCCWQILGEGQFQPLPGSQPFLGQVGQLQKLPEYKVEMIVAAHCLQAVLQALLNSHPYQQPAYWISERWAGENGATSQTT